MMIDLNGTPIQSAFNACSVTAPTDRRKCANQYQKDSNIRLHADDVFVHDLYQTLSDPTITSTPFITSFINYSTLLRPNKKLPISITISTLFIYRCWILRTLKKQTPLCRDVEAAMKLALPSSRVLGVEGNRTRSLKLQENLFPYQLQ